MTDINRLPVDCFVLHHAVTPAWPEKSKAELAQWFSDNGFARAYGSNANNWSGLINPYTGARSYSQAHICGQQVDASTPDATAEERKMGFRWVPLVDDIWGQICWHAGNWKMNCRSIGIECLGDYRNYTLRDWDARVLGAFWRPQDLKFGGATAIWGHKEVSDAATECPARIMEMRDTVVGYCNNPPVDVPPVVINPLQATVDKLTSQIENLQTIIATMDKSIKETTNRLVAADKEITRLKALPPKEIIKEVIKEVPVEVIKEVIKEVPVEKIVTVIKEVPIDINTLSFGELLSAVFKKLLTKK